MKLTTEQVIKVITSIGFENIKGTSLYKCKGFSTDVSEIKTLQELCCEMYAAGRTNNQTEIKNALNIKS